VSNDVAEIGASTTSHVVCVSSSSLSHVSFNTTSSQTVNDSNCHFLGKLKSTKIWQVTSLSIQSPETVTINHSCFNETSELFTL
jgi:hypothetical protein